MNYKNYLTGIICSLSIFSLLFLGSCSKESSDTVTPEQEAEVSRVSSESEAEAEMIFNRVFDDAMGVNADVAIGGTGVFGRAGMGTPDGSPETARPTACLTVTITHPTTNPFPVRVEMDFGPVPCLWPDGHTRRGKIITEYTNRLLVPGAVATTVFQDYFIDSMQVEGTHKITNTGTGNPNTPPARQFTVEVIDGKITKHNGNYIEWNSTRVITQLEGLATPDIPIDDVFKIEGHSRGRALRGSLLVAWESSVIEPLIKRFNCRWIVKGAIRTVRLNATTNTPWVAVLDFGNGTCDNQAVITINGISHQITLR